MRSTIGDWLGLAALAGLALLVVRNKSTLTNIGAGINTTVSGALKKVESKVVKDASKE